MKSNHVKSINATSWQPHDILRVETLMMTPDWFIESVKDGWVSSSIHGDVAASFHIYPELSRFYQDNIAELINIVWDSGLRPACFRPFCCCEYKTPGFPGYESNVSEISASSLVDMDTYTSGPIEIEVFEDYWQQDYIDNIRELAKHLGASFDEVFLENGYEQRRKCDTTGCPILFKGDRYKVAFNSEARKTEVELIPDGVTWP
ncbi:hypothetical protein CU669_03620 [Paramagnetospirillum kuznetsovii]|uniref:Uncharacterized protein n=2 Tax=Paramagnetospirillum kuznetsovii TaxID=2053833 RepID=A0A364P1N8_9PROT|nr:hypothetical protein CU669_03620 [Paramagnetospirillum kuznetsovii]